MELRSILVSALAVGAGAGLLAMFPFGAGVQEKPPAAPASRSSPQPTLNVLLVTLDTTRADHVGAYGYAAASTPVLDGLARGGTLFEHAYSPCPLTLPAHATILTGLEPPEHALRINGRSSLAPEIETLAETLRAGGYRTGAFVAAFVLDGKFGLDQGFDTYDDDLSAAVAQEIPEELSRYRPGNVVTDAALAWLGQAPGKPFLAWVHLYDAHIPYHDSDDPQAAPSYDSGIAFQDRQVGRLMTFLSEHGLADKTLIVLVGDHGEGLDDHGEYEHGHLLNEEVLRVPLIFSLPGRIEAGRRVPSIVSLRDLHPTLIEMLVPGGNRQGGGRSIAGALRGQALESVPSYAETDFPHDAYGWSAQRSLTTEQWKYIRTTRPELYDRKTDPGEIYNLATVRTEDTRRLESQLAALESAMTAAAPAGTVSLDADESARLSSLGYVSSQAAPARHKDDKPLRDVKDMLAVRRMEIELRRGMAFDAFSPQQILEVLTSLVADSPETASFQLRLGTALMDAGRHEEALAPLRETLRIDPRQANAELNLGVTLMALDREEDAIAALARSLAIDPQQSAAHTTMAKMLRKLGRADSALGHLSEATRLEPGNLEAHRLTAEVLASRGRREEAAAAYARLLAVNPDNPDVHYDLGNLLLGLERYQEAAAHYEETLRLRPRDLEAMNNLAVALTRLGRLDDALERYRQAIEIDHDFARAYLNLANLHAARGSFPEALRNYAEALRIQPRWSEVAERLAHLLATCEDESLRNGARAVELAERAVEASSRRNPRSMATLAAAYRTAGMHVDAREAATRALGLARAANLRDLAAEIEREAKRDDQLAAAER